MAGNHPWEKKTAGRDEFYGRKSSLGGETCKYSAGGSILRLEIILERRNQQIRMKSAAGNHPWEKKFANRDEISGRKSSLGGEPSKSG